MLGGIFSKWKLIDSYLPVYYINIFFEICTCRYLQKARYKKNQKKADKATNVISVAKKGKNNVLTTNNKADPTINNTTVSVGGGANFKIPKIEQPIDLPEINCKPHESNNISIIGVQIKIILYILWNVVIKSADNA